MSNAWQPSRELTALLTKLVDGELSADDRRSLEKILRDEAPARRYYISLMSLHTRLHSRFEKSLDVVTEESGGNHALVESDLAELARPRGIFHHGWQQTLHFFARPTPLSLSVASLAITSLLLVLAAIAPPVYRELTRSMRPEAELAAPMFVASLTGSYQAKWAEGQIGTVHGAHLKDGHRMQLKSGLAEITYRSGVIVVLQGPADLVVGLGEASDARAASGSGFLQSGRLTALVPPAAVGFRIDTTVASIVDLGTEFGVAADVRRGTEVQVFRGSVQARMLGDSAARIILAGEAFRFERGGGEGGVAVKANQLALQLPDEDVIHDPFVKAIKASRPTVLWRLNERNANVAHSSFGRPSGSFRGNVKSSLLSRPGDDDGRSMQFNGVDSFVDVPYSSNLNSDNFTVEAWVRPELAPSGFASIITSRADKPQTTGFIIYISPSGTWEFWTGNGQNWDMLVGPRAESGVWTHVAITFEKQAVSPMGVISGTKRMFINGELTATKVNSLYMPHVFQSYPLRIAAGSTENEVPQFFFAGHIADVAVYGRVLAPQELASHYQAATSPASIPADE